MCENAPEDIERELNQPDAPNCPRCFNNENVLSLAKNPEIRRLIIDGWPITKWKCTKCKIEF